MKKLIISCIVLAGILAAADSTVWKKFKYFAGTYSGVDVHKFIDGSTTCYLAVSNADSMSTGNNVAISCVK